MADELSRRTAEAEAYTAELLGTPGYVHEYQVAWHLADIERYVFDLEVEAQRKAGATEEAITEFWESMAPFAPDRSAPDSPAG
jgi:hypothetical protein